jgi:tetratricopeptide (TPR) repeat protein
MSPSASEFIEAGKRHYDQQHYSEAIAAFHEAIRLDPTHAYPHHLLGYIYTEQKQYPEAIAAFREAIRLDPSDAENYISLGMVYRSLQQYPEAIAALLEAIRLDSTSAVTHASLAACYRLQADEAQEQEHLAHARTLMQTESDYNKACIETIAGNYEEALRLLKEGNIAANELALAQTDPDLEPLRDDPRFRALVGLH